MAVIDQIHQLTKQDRTHTHHGSGYLREGPVQRNEQRPYRWCHAPVSHNRRPMVDCRSLTDTFDARLKPSIWARMRASLASGICTVQVSRQMSHPIQVRHVSSEALCQLIGMPKIRKRMMSDDDAQRGAVWRSNHARRSSTYCHRAWWWSRSA